MDYKFTILAPPQGRPLYWMDETSGEMKIIVQRFLDAEASNLSEYEILVIREYMLQWCMAPAFQVSEEDLQQLAAANSKEELMRMYDKLTDQAVDPF